MCIKVLEFIRENWSLIVISIGFAIYTAVYTYEEITRYSDEEKMAITKRLIATSIDVIVAEAEIKFSDYEKSGQLKRSYVIQVLFEKYPVLNKVINQESLLVWIDKLITESVMRLKNNASDIDRK